ncbi:hydroxymethylbilane synthase [Brackiella oedipodis]|uniref:hydroxymethylbilane synthase n=1 Tax=Brackiella oedipodis TaxID=124225 RepID=UPI00048A6C75|nr:hydroxymethylbilane synthase [Brackiella oedipodis]
MSTPQLPRKITIATRESRLAVWQAEFVKQQLQQHYPDLDVELLKMSTKGDRILDKTLSKIGGKGLFIKELENALLDGRADCAVHSLKDVPVEMPEGFELSTILKRADHTDAFVSNHYEDLASLPEGAIVGTSSLRRESQIRAKYPHLQVKPLRGNLDTRLRKLDEQQYDAIVLASAGLKRMGMAQRIRSTLSISDMLPAVGQGALGIEILASRNDLKDVFKVLMCPETTLTCQAERAVSAALGGSCQVPLAVHASLQEDVMSLQALVALPNGRQLIYAQASDTQQHAAAITQSVIDSLKAQGALELIADVLQENQAQ